MLLATFLVVPPAFAQSMDDPLEDFQLYNACRPMHWFVETLPEDAQDIELTRESLHLAAESRLRAGRLYREDVDPPDSMLVVSVRVVGLAFNIDLSYGKLVRDMFGQPGPATTWERGVTGTSYIVFHTEAGQFVK